MGLLAGGKTPDKEIRTQYVYYIFISIIFKLKLNQNKNDPKHNSHHIISIYHVVFVILVVILLIIFYCCFVCNINVL